MWLTSPTSPALTSHFLVDLALHRASLHQLFDSDSIPRHELLYRYTQQTHLANSGPLLIAPALPESCHPYRQWVNQGLAIELQGTRTFDDIATHLRTLTMVARDQVPPALFRYADARLYAAIGATLRDDERAHLLGPIEIMSGVATDKPWQLRQPSVNADRHVPTDTPFRLTTRHEQGLSTWRQMGFLMPLASQYGLPIERLLGWFHTMQAMGLGSEQTCYAGCQHLANLGIDRPIDAHRAAIQAYRGTGKDKLTALETRLANANEYRQGETP